MGLLDILHNRVKGLIKIGGTLVSSSGNDLHPTVIGNEVMGGTHGYSTLEELANLPIQRIHFPMIAIVREHLRPGGESFKRTTYVFAPTTEDWNALLASGYDRISEIPNYDLSQYWKINNPVGDDDDTLEIQYAAGQDYGLGLSRPAFQEPTISVANYQSGYKSTADNTVIWHYDYVTGVDLYVRQRFGSTSSWGIPMLIFGDQYSKGDYIDNQFRWITKGQVPVRPPSMIEGSANNDPDGWFGTPVTPGGEDYYDFAVTNDLYMIKASKNAYGVLKSEWSIPQLISTDPELVRYGNKPSSRPFINGDGSDTADWKGYYTPKVDTYMARRLTNISSDWEVTMIDQESGRYRDFIFKAFPMGYEIIEDDRPTIAQPFSEVIGDYPNNGWQDSPFQVGEKEVLYRSLAWKFNTGDLMSSGWSFPVRNDGLSTIQVIITPVSESLFKYNSLGVATPSVINLQAKFYKGKDEITPDVNFKWYKGSSDNANEIIKGLNTGVSANHTITGTNNYQLAVSNLAVDNTQLYTVKAVFSGEDYFDVQTIVDVTDSLGIVPAIIGNDGFVFKNQIGDYTFDAILYINGIEQLDDVTYEWYLDAVDITPVLSPETVEVSGGDFDGKAVLTLNILYKGITYSVKETLVDVEDGQDVIIQYSIEEVPENWTTSPVDAIWMRISVDGGVTWNEVKVKGESAPYNGGFYQFAYKLSATEPTGMSNAYTSDLLPDVSWSNNPLSPITGQDVWVTKAFFRKDPSTSEITETSANWLISGSWSSAKIFSHYAEDGEATVGPAGPAGVGTSGLTPIFAVEELSDFTEVLKIIDWVDSPIPAVPQYVSSSGLTVTNYAGTNIKGSKGNDGASGTPLMWSAYISSTQSGAGTYRLYVDLGSLISGVFKIEAFATISSASGTMNMALRASTSSFTVSTGGALFIDRSYYELDANGTSDEQVYIQNVGSISMRYAWVDITISGSQVIKKAGITVTQVINATSRNLF